MCISLRASLKKSPPWRHTVKGADMPTRYRDAVTGEYVTEQEAKKRPRETVKDSDKKRTAKEDEALIATVRERQASAQRVKVSLDDL